MTTSSDEKEKRISPRVRVDLPVNFQATGNPNIQSGLTVNASETGLLVQTPKDMPVGTKLIVEVLYPKGFQLSNFQGVAEIKWKVIHLAEKWEGYEYGLRFVEISDENQLELKRLLDNHSSFKVAYLSREFETKAKLTIQVR
jgi:hypothetical protein